MSGLPPGTVGDAVGVLIYTFISLLTDLVLIWLLWVHRERFGYVALIAYFVALSIVISIIHQIYQYTHFSENFWRRYRYIKANYPNADVIFKDGNSGLTLVFSNLRYYCYTIECTYLFTFTLHIATSVFGVWTVRRRAERIYIILSKIVPIIITAITIGVEYTPAVQSDWITYLIVANVQTVASCVFSIVLIAMVLWKYVDTKKIWKSITMGPILEGSSVSWKAWVLKKWRRSSKNRSSSSEQTPRKRDHVPKSLLDNNWLVVRLLIAIVFISGFILVFILVHLPVPAQMAREIMADAPELTAATARAAMVGHIYGVLPGLAVPIVFGLTKPFRHTLCETFRVKRWWTMNRGQRIPPARSRPDSQVITAWPQLREPIQDSEFRVSLDLDSNPATLRQDWIMRMDVGMPTDSTEEVSYELSEGTNQH